MNPLIDQYIQSGCGRCPLGGTPECKVNNWQAELKALRLILLDSELTEELKWGVPCYTLKGHNVILLSALKDHCVLSFIKGSLLDDPHKLLTKPGENTRDGRVIRLTSLPQIQQLENKLRFYVQQAIEVEKSGLKPSPAADSDQIIPEELQLKFKELPDLKTAFFALTPGRQRSYLIHFSQPKQSKTRESRIEKCIPDILQGKGFNEDYKKRSNKL